MQVGFNVGTLNSQVALNVFKHNSGWDTLASGTPSGQEALLVLDTNGYPTTLSGGGLSASTTVRTAILSSTTYDGGTWVLLYDGDGEFTFGGGGRDTPTVDVDDHENGRYELHVASPTSAGFYIHIATSNPADHVRNIRVVHEDYESSLEDDGEIFHPDFLAIHGRSYLLRFMDLFGPIYDNREVDWSDRVPAGWYKWYPILPHEMAIALCNKLGAHCWVTVPYNATDAYMTSMAELYLAGLNGTLSVIPEFANETWNDIAGGGRLGQQPQIDFCATSAALDPPIRFYGEALPNAYQHGYAWSWVRACNNADIWEGVWTGDANARCLTVFGDQLGRHAQSLGNPDVNYHETDIADHFKLYSTAPYFGGGFLTPMQWTADEDVGAEKMLNEMVGDDVLLPDYFDVFVTTTGTSTAYTASNGGSPPVVGDIVCLDMHTVAGTDPTLSFNGGTAYPLMSEHPDVSIAPGSVAYAFQLCDETEQGAIDTQWIQCGFLYKSSRNTAALPDMTTDGIGIMQQSFDVMSNGINWIADHYPHLRVWTYEGGQHFMDPYNRLTIDRDNIAVQNAFSAWMRDPGMYDAYYYYLEGLRDAGVEVFSQFHDIGGFSKFGWWGSLEAQSSNPTSPRYDAIQDFIAAEAGEISTLTLRFSA